MHFSEKTPFPKDPFSRTRPTPRSPVQKRDARHNVLQRNGGTTRRFNSKRRRSRDLKLHRLPALNGQYPQYGWDFQEEIRKHPEKNPEALSERFLEFPSRVRLGSPKPYNSRHLRLPEHFQNSLSPPVRLGTPLFSEVVPERASQSRPSTSQY